MIHTVWKVNDQQEIFIVKNSSWNFYLKINYRLWMLFANPILQQILNPIREGSFSPPPHLGAKNKKSVKKLYFFFQPISFLFLSISVKNKYGPPHPVLFQVEDLHIMIPGRHWPKFSYPLLGELVKVLAFWTEEDYFFARLRFNISPSLLF